MAKFATNKVQYGIRLADPFGESIKNIDSFISIEYARKVNDIGSMTLVLPDEYPPYLFAIDSRLEVWRGYPSNLKLDMDTIWLIRKVADVIDKDGTRQYQITAYDALHLLKRRIVPYNDGNPESQKQDWADDMCKEIVYENLGAGAADVNRDLSAWLSIDADFGAAPQATKLFSRRIVMEVLQEIAQSSYDNGTFLAFDLVYDPIGRRLTFKTYTGQRGVDRSGSGNSKLVIVGENYNGILSASLTFDHEEEYNYIYAAGQSVGDIVAIYEIGDDAAIGKSPFNRCEFLQNASGTDDADELKEEAKAALSQYKAKTILQCEIDALAKGSEYGIDFGYGDKIAIEFGGKSYNVLVNAISVKVDGADEQVSAVLSNVTD
jgi:hypothetical protein